MAIGYAFFWSGRGLTERRKSDVGFAVKSHLLQKLTKLPVGHNDRLMSLQLPLSKIRNATLISVHAPTMTYSDHIKDKFYDELSTLITAIPRADKIFVLGDFNARVGVDHHTSYTVT